MAKIIQDYLDELTEDTCLIEVQARLADNDMRFIHVDGGQWEDMNTENDWGDRAKLEFDLVTDYVQRFIGEWNNNRVGVEYKAEDGASEDDAELLNGIYRGDFRQNSGKVAVDNAVDEVSTVGYGCFKLVTFFEEEGDAENENQRIGWQPINNAYDTVVWDSSAKRIDKRDAKRCAELIPFTHKKFKEKWPDKTPVTAYTPEQRFHSDWLVQTHDIIYVAARYDVIEIIETRYVYNNLETGKVESYSEEQHEAVKDELEKDELRRFVRKRKVPTQIVKKVVFSGQEVLEQPKRIPGKYIPIIAMYGYHAFVDNSERYRGLVRKLKDAARLFNSQVSQLAENSASSGQEVPIFTPDQVQGFEKEWADRNNKPYLLLNKQLDYDGNIVAAAPTSYLKPALLDQSTASLMQIVPTYIQQVTGRTPDETRDPRASGKAIREARKLENLNTQTVTDNIHNSIEWSGTVYAAMATDGIYTTQRMVNTLGKDGTESQELLREMVHDEQTGKLVESKNLDGKRFRVYSDIGPQTETLREATVQDMKGMLESLSDNPAGQKYTDVIMATMIENVSGIGIGPLKDFNRKQMILAGYVKPKTDEEKQLLAQAQQPQEDPQVKLVEAAAAQAQGEARERESKVIDNTAAAQLKTAQTEKVLSDIEVAQAGVQNDRIKTLSDVRKQVFDNAQRITLQ